MSRDGRKGQRAATIDQSSLIGYNKFTPYLFSTPALAVIGLILAFPVLYGIYESLLRPEVFGGPKEFVGLGNYAELLDDPAFWSALGRSFVFIAGCIVLGLSLGLFFAFALNRAMNRLRFLRAVTILPYIVSSVAAAVMFRILFNQDFGPPNRVLEFIGVDGPAWLVDPRLAMVVVIVAQVWSDLPLSILVLLGGLQTIDAAHMDAALVDGASGWTRARYITLPLIAPQIVLSLVWLSYTCLTALGVILALTGGGPGTATQTLPMEMYTSAFRRLDMNQALAIANIILLLNAVLALLYIAVGRRYRTE